MQRVDIYGLLSLLLLSVAATSQMSLKVDSTEPVHRLRRVRRSSGDISLDALLTIVQQQSASIERLEHDFYSYKTQTDNQLMRMKQQVNTASRSVAFTARISDCQETDEHGLILRHHQTVVFDDVVTNVGDAYNFRSGIFTAPVSGTYVFSLQQVPTDQERIVHLAIVKNGEILQLVFSEGTRDPHTQGTSQVTSHLVAGDRVWFRQHRGNRVRTSWWTVFTGFLLHAH